MLKSGAIVVVHLVRQLRPSKAVESFYKISMHMSFIYSLTEVKVLVGSLRLVLVCLPGKSWIELMLAGFSIDISGIVLKSISEFRKVSCIKINKKLVKEGGKLLGKEKRKVFFSLKDRHSRPFWSNLLSSRLQLKKIDYFPIKTESSLTLLYFK